MKKLVLVLIFLFLTTGCSVTSNITINKDLTVKEEVKMTGTSEFFSTYYKSRPITTVNMLLNSGNRRETLIKNGYQYYIDESGNYPVVIANKNYSSINSFVTNTIFKEQYFENFETTEVNNLITIKAYNFIKYIEGDVELYEIDNFALNIKLPYVVTSHNADKYNSKTNTYTWYIQKETEDKEINLTFDKNRVYVYNLVMYISIFLLCLLGVILIIVIRKIVIKSKKNNKIIE